MPRVSQEELGNYFVVPLGPNADGSQFARSDPNGLGNDDHVEFRNFYWNFADNRPMFLLFNNYGWSREASRQEGAWNGHALPVPSAAAVRRDPGRAGKSSQKRLYVKSIPPGAGGRNDRRHCPGVIGAALRYRGSHVVMGNK